MATSSSYNFNLTRDEIFKETLELIGALSPGETLKATQAETCTRTLQMMIKFWQADSIGMWVNKEIALFLEKNENSYLIGPSSPDHCADTWAKTELAAAAASSATSITIDATTGMGDTFDRDGIITATTPGAATNMTLTGTLVANGVATLSSERKILIYSDGNDSGVTFAITGTDADGVTVTETITGPNISTAYSSSDYKTITGITISGAGTGNIEVGQVGDLIGIELDTGTLQWTYMGAALSTTTTLIDALTGAASIDNHIYSYTTRSQRPLEIQEVRTVRADGTEIPIDIISRNEYMELSNKTTTATATSVYWNPQRTNAIMRVWPAGDDVQEYIRFTGKYPIQDMDVGTDNFDFPQEWLGPIAWQLALWVAPKFGKVLDQGFRDDAKEKFDEVKDFDREYAPVYIELGNDRHNYSNYSRY